MRRAFHWADTAGVLGAVLAALCCAGATVIVSALAAVGLGALRNDSILWPLMALSLAVALWGLAGDRRDHRQSGPLLLAVVAGAALVAGVVFVHGPPARALINAGAAGLIAATGWNVSLRRRSRGSVATM